MSDEVYFRRAELGVALFRGDSRVEWSFVVPYLALLPLDAAQRKYNPREVACAYLDPEGKYHLPHTRWISIYQASS
ncbi:hypothetical protein [Allomeiothermus silvanus]|uniref:hypothetical protein n=1 Tax=Allomeiothermus silvanus TaxID=52022 RepID=UPI0023F37D83|nr:hypothetical protein [Allomeiothermus silvanus]